LLYQFVQAFDQVLNPISGVNPVTRTNFDKPGSFDIAFFEYSPAGLPDSGVQGQQDGALAGVTHLLTAPTGRNTAARAVVTVVC
jgi:hypothetical protein